MSLGADECRRYLAERLAALPEVRLAYLFGSRARGRARADSDFDVAVLVDDERVADATGVSRMIRHLAGRLGGDVPADLLHIVLLNGAPPLLRHRVLREGKMLHARAESERVRFAIRTIREYQDIEPRLAEHTRRRVARLKEGTGHGGSGDILEAARRAGRLLGASGTDRAREPAG